MAAIGLFSASGYLLSKAAIGVPLTALTVVIAIVKLLGVTRAFSRYGERYYSHRASFTVLGHIRKTFYRRLDQSFSTLMQKYQSGDLLSRMVGDIESLQTYFLRVLYPPMLLFFIFLTTIFFILFFILGCCNFVYWVYTTNSSLAHPLLLVADENQVNGAYG